MDWPNDADGNVLRSWWNEIHSSVKAVTALAGPDRYSHFIKVAADQRSVWGLYQSGWALMQDATGRSYFPVWPAEPYAEQCAVADWQGYVSREIDLDTFLEVLLPKLQASDTELAVFPTPADKGVVPEIAVLERDLRMELSKIE